MSLEEISYDLGATIPWMALIQTGRTILQPFLGIRKFYYCTAWVSKVIYIVYLIMLLVSTLSFSLGLLYHLLSDNVCFCI